MTIPGFSHAVNLISRPKIIETPGVLGEGNGRQTIDPDTAFVQAYSEKHKPKPLINMAYDNAHKLVEDMKARKAHWERELANATEQLRQVNVILQAAETMRGDIASGMPAPEPELDEAALIAAIDAMHP